ncbi:hypothetical protein GCM10023215_19160 [Pseudonocardia yuanmonensis]|uniref:Uncharacterized protein n=1 Tax=Pseudonocardia yuanmonensis TaxID=1095914 RepID=A0ABP8W9S9_9PSEU
MFVHGHPRALGWVKGHYRAPNTPAGEQLGLDLELAPAEPEIPRPREESATPTGSGVEDRPARSRSRVSAGGGRQTSLIAAVSDTAISDD